MLLVRAASAAPAENPAGPALAGEEPQGQVWSSDFEDACRQSRILNVPLLALSDLKQCPYCREFRSTLAAPASREKLSRFVLFRFDVEDDWQVARVLRVNAAPVVVVLAPSGVPVARSEGYVDVATFLAWLDEAEANVALIDPARLADCAPDELVRALSMRDPVVREAVTDALVSQPGAAPLVVDALASGGLACRLGALEILQTWEAPLDGLDPWEPETVPPAVEELRRWAQSAEAGTSRSKPSPDAIERDLRLWMDGEEGPETRASYERLARAGAELLPQVRGLVPSGWDRRRERLTALCYRLQMPGPAAARFPQVPFQMAAREAQVRVKAIDTVADAFGAELEGFFLEAFGDPDAKVREAAVRGLRKAGGEIARENVLRLLADPSPDVRATVLKELVESPLPEVADDLAKYASSESDEDLVVHATQALRAVRSEKVAFETLVKLTEHASWRVRAEAVESFGNVSTSGRELSALPRGHDAAIAAMLERALKDEDVFVTDKAIEVIGALDQVDLSNCLGGLGDVAREHPDLALQALGTMASHPSMRTRAGATIRELCKHEDPAIRAGAIRALVSATELPALDGVTAALSDSEASVRTAAADALFQWAAENSGADGQRVVPISSSSRGRLLAPLRKGMSADDAEERFTALMALVALGNADAALPGLLAAAALAPGYAERAADAAGFLPWPQRKELFLALRQQPLNESAWCSLFAALCQTAPEDAEGFIWQVFDDDPHVLASPYEVLNAIVGLYGFEGGLWTRGSAAAGYGDALRAAAGGGPNAVAARLSRAARERMQSGDARRAVMGLLLLCRADPTAGQAEARRMWEAPASDVVRPELRRASLGILLCIGGSEHEELVIKTLASEDEDLRHMALRSLLRTLSPFGPSLFVRVGDQTVWTEFLGSDRMEQILAAASGRDRQAWSPPKMPEGLSLELLRPFLADSDQEVSGGAAYLMSLLGDARGLASLAATWRTSKDDPDLWKALAQAVAAIGDDENVPLLREIYASFDADSKEYYGADLYWTIRGLAGPQAKQLRKEMRDELGQALAR